MNHALQAAIISSAGVALIVQGIKALLPDLPPRLVPFLAGLVGVLGAIGLTWLLGGDFNRSMVLAGLIAGFGPTGVYEVVTKMVTAGAPAPVPTLPQAVSSWPAGAASDFIPPSSTSPSVSPDAGFTGPPTP